MPEDTPRELTPEEVEDHFLEHVRVMVEYWAGEGPSNVPAEQTHRDRLEGLAHSMLVAIDGGSMALPKFVFAPNPHPDDRDFYRSEGRNYFPDNNSADVKADISGGLHELLFNRGRWKRS